MYGYKPNHVYIYGFLFYCMVVGQASYSMTALTKKITGVSLHVVCLQAQGGSTGGFINSDSLIVESHLLCCITVYQLI